MVRWLAVSTLFTTAACDVPPGPVHETSGALQTTPSSKNRSPSVASDGTTMMLAWPEVVGGKREIFIQAFNTDGSPVDGSRTQVTPVNGLDKGDVHLTAGGGKFLVVFEQLEASGFTTTQAVVAQRHSAGVPAIARTMFAIDATANESNVHPRATFDSQRSKFFVAYQNGVDGTRPRILGRFVAASGAPDSRITVGADANSAYTDPDVAYAPSTGTILVAWGAFGGFEKVFISTIRSPASNPFGIAQNKLELINADNVSLTFNAATNRFGLALLDDLPDSGGITVATLPATCLTASGGTNCTLLKTPTNVVKTPRGSRLVMPAIAPLGTGLTVAYSQQPATSGEPTSAPVMFLEDNAGTPVVRGVMGWGSRPGMWIGTGSVDGVVAGKSVLVYRELTSANTLKVGYRLLTPPLIVGNALFANSESTVP